MYRPSRLIAETVSVDNLDFPDFYFELQKGDTCTGFEIIASLPLEEQGLTTMVEIRKEDYIFWVRTKDWKIDPHMLYVWNGESWEVLDEHKRD